MSHERGKELVKDNLESKQGWLMRLKKHYHDIKYKTESAAVDKDITYLIDEVDYAVQQASNMKQSAF